MIELASIGSNGDIRFMIDRKRYVYETGDYLIASAIRKKAVRKPGEALDIVKKLKCGWVGPDGVYHEGEENV